MNTHLDQLALELDGELVRPGDPTWDAARQAWNLAVDQRPAAVVIACSVRDVQTVVREAASLGLRVAPQSTGHNAAPLGDLAGTILLRLSELNGVTVDPMTRTMRVEGGATWGDVTPAVTRYGLAALAGSAADVGVAGYTLGGGVSWLARSHGLAANHVISLEVVTADGEIRCVDAENDPELFWALRGGGGSFGIVTALELRLFPLTHLQAGTLFYPLEKTAEVLHAWRELTQDLPNEVMTVGRVLRFPPVPDLPPFLSGQSYVVVEVAATLSASALDELLGPLRSLDPAIDTVAEIAVDQLAQLHMDPPAPVPGAGDGWLMRELTPAAIDSLARVVGPGVDSPLLSVELRLLGGALAPTGEHGVVDGFDAAYLGFAVGLVLSPEHARAISGAITEVQHVLAPWTAPGSYLNFAEVHKQPEALFGRDGYARLQQVKKAYDPLDVIRSNHPVTVG